jgi:hypothetical protein
MEKIGRILIVDHNNHPVATALWDIPLALRTPQVLAAVGELHSIAQDAAGRWIYRVEGVVGNRPPDSDLKEYKFPTDADWDGPAITVPAPTFADVDEAFRKLLANNRLHDAGKVSLQQVMDLYRLFKQVWGQ